MTLVYVDTSVLVALRVSEPQCAAVARWYARTRANLVAAAWCVTEFASAMGIKQRTSQLTGLQAQAAWERFSRLTANDLKLLPVDPAQLHRAATLTLDPTTALRAGDALHLAPAEHAGAGRMATLDAVLGRNAQRLKIASVVFV